MNSPTISATVDQTLDVVHIDTWDPPDMMLYRIVERYNIDGFVVVQGPNPGRAALTAITSALTLGQPFVPPIYRGSDHTGMDGVSALTAARIGGDDHPFHDRGGQYLHCDGTLQTLGQIPTTVMMCVRPARTGGTTILFDAPAAFLALHAADSAAAEQLVHPAALVRTATVVHGQSTSGPAFGWQAGQLLTRFSLTGTDTYHPREPGEQADLERALAYMRDAARPGSPHRREFAMASGQTLILANDKLCHGRTAYEDSPHELRLLLRALYTRRPTARTDGHR